ncbi:hypothetical protein SteCoe_17433 [Stentor coeruleus]|uniref:Uncharacterized protein n=1 Tax=Stentor coeruleus TaxID=5963 RepID=A0A1R2BYY4_9CILI|nr:hypothetical protein SteCoe_17433 [Stentor coeruleus]
MELSIKGTRNLSSLRQSIYSRCSNSSKTSPYSIGKFFQSTSIVNSPAPSQVRKKLNRIPVSNFSHRITQQISSPKPFRKSLKQRQQQLKTHFSAINLQQKHLTALILNSREKNIDTIVENHDSFSERYIPSKHKFSHKLIGDIQLPRKFFNIIPQEKELEKARLIRTKPKPLQISPSVLNISYKNLQKSYQNKIHDRYRRAMSSIKHYKILKIDPMIIHKIHEFLPGVPYGIPKSKEFLIACKEGNSEDVVLMLEANKWLAHVFDSSGQSSLHWAVKRGHLKIAMILIAAGTWVDNLDFAGRSPLFIAVKVQNVDMINVLLMKNANVRIKTRAGTSIFERINSVVIKSLLDKHIKKLGVIEKIIG